MAKPDTTYEDQQSTYRLDRLIRHAEQGYKPEKALVMRRTVNGQVIEANTNGIGDRTASYSGGRFVPVERSLRDRMVPDGAFKGLKKDALGLYDAGKILNPDLDKQRLAKAADYIGTYYRWNGLLMPEYDMREPHSISDTEGYFKQTVARKLALVARAGYEIVSERDEDADYIQSRIDAMEFVTERTFENWLQDVLRNLFSCSNCFLLKIRSEEASPVPKNKKNGKTPVAAYTIIPAHTVQPFLKDGKIVKWRRLFEHGIPFIDYDVDEIVHLKWDVKAGHIYGTPRTIAVRDDIFALRRLEENIELLFINHLFPLFHVKVGNEKAPCTYGPGGESEIDMVRYQIENMPKEGVFVSDERVEIEAVGAEGKSLDFDKLVAHFKARVYVGLGMSAIDMGEGADATRATADNISQNLKDSIKADLDNLAGQLRMLVFKEWFMEANYSTSVQKGTARTKLAFRELDLDNRIKEETHIMGLFNSHLITETEARRRMNLKPIKGSENDGLERKNLHFDLHVIRLEREITKFKTKSQLEIGEADVQNQKALAGTQMKLLAAQTSHSEATAEHHNSKLEAQAKHMPVIAKAKVAVANASAKRAQAAGRGKPRSGTAKKSTPTSAAVGNKIRPTNQHGTKLGPNRDSLYEGLISVREQLLADGEDLNLAWRDRSAQVIDQEIEILSQSEITELDGASYTRKERIAGLQSLRSVIQETSDPELISVLIASHLEDEVDNAELESALADHHDQHHEE